MDLLEVLKSLDSSFSGNLDDTLLNRLASSLHCPSILEHQTFWNSFETSCTGNIIDYLKELFISMTNALKLETLCHSNIVKVVLVLLERSLPQIPLESDLLAVVHSFVRAGLTESAFVDVQHAIMDGLCVLLNGFNYEDSCLKSLLQFVIVDDVIASAIQIFASSASIFVKKIGLQFLGRVLHLHDQLLHSNLPLTVAKLKAMFNKNSHSVCEIFAAVLSNGSSVNIINNSSENFFCLFENSFLSSFTLETSSKHISVHLFVFYLAWNELKENTKSEINSIQKGLSLQLKRDVLLQLIRLAANSSIKFNINHAVIDISMITAFEADLLRTFTEKDRKQCRRYFDTISLQKCPSLVSVEVLNQVHPFAMDWILTSDLVPRFFSCLSFEIDKKVEVSNKLLHLIVDTSDERYLVALESLCTDLLNTGNMGKELLSRILESLKPFVLKECEHMDRMNFSFCYCNIVASMSFEDNFTEFDQLLSYQNVCMLSYIERAELQLFPCLFLDMALKLLSTHMNRTPTIAHSSIKTLLDMCDGVIKSSSFSSEFRELLICLSLHVLLCVKAGSQLSQSMRAFALTLSTYPFDFPLPTLSALLSSLFVTAASPDCNTPQSGDTLSTLATLTINILDNGTLDWNCVTKDWVSALDSLLLQSSFDTALLFVLKSRLLTVDGLFVPCAQCGERIETLLADILIAKEAATKIDCVGD